METDHLQTPSPLNPLGIKGAGEAGVIPGMAVLAAAIEDAEGFRITRMPISPSELFALRAEHAAGRIPGLRRAAPAASPRRIAPAVRTTLCRGELPDQDVADGAQPEDALRDSRPGSGVEEAP